MVTVSDGKCRPQTSRLKLTADTLVLQKEEFIFPDDEDGYPVDNKVIEIHQLKVLLVIVVQFRIELMNNHNKLNCYIDCYIVKSNNWLEQMLATLFELWAILATNLGNVASISNIRTFCNLTLEQK